MSCQVKYKNNGSIARVNTPNGVESKLFNQISRLPIIGQTLETALDTYKQTYSNKIEIDHDNEPTLLFESDSGRHFSDLKSALKDSKSLVNIGLFDNSGAFKSLMTYNTTADLDTRQGKINYMIKSDLMSAENVIENGISYFKSEGFDQVRQIVNEEYIKDILPIINIHKDGKIEVLEKEGIKSDVDKAIESVLTLKNPLEPVLTEDDLKSRLLEFLNSIGVETTNIENYKKRYKIKNGVDPSAEALADISNQVIAFREGSINLENLTEETAHFIIEGWNDTEIQNLLQGVVNTDTYLQHAENYRAIYSRENTEMTPEQIEDLVRREVLGKELANTLLSRSEQGFLQSLYEKVLEWFNKLILPNNYQNNLADISNKVYEALINRDLNNYVDSSNFKTKKFKLYNTTNTSTQAQKNLVNSLLEQEKALRKVGRGSKTSLDKLQSALNEAVNKKTIQDLTSMAKRQAEYVKSAISEVTKKGTTLTPEQVMVYQNLTSYIRPAMSGLLASVKEQTSYSNEVKDLNNTINTIVNDVEGVYKNTENSVLNNAVDRIMKKNRIGDGIFDSNDNIIPISVVRVNYERSGFNGTFEDYMKDKETVKDRIKLGIKTVNKDTSFLYSYFGQITHSSDPLLNILGNIISDMKTEQEHEFINRIKSFQKTLRDKGYKPEDLKKLVQEDGYVTSEWDFAEYENFKNFAKVTAYIDNFAKITKDLENRISLTKDSERLESELKEHLDFYNTKLKNANFSTENIEELSDFPVISSDVVRGALTTDIQLNVNKGTETYLAEDYAEKRKKEFDALGVSDITRARMRFFSELRGQLKREMSVSDSGTPMYTRQNKADLEYINTERKKSMSIVDSNGDIKNGLNVLNYEAPGYIKQAEGVYISLNSNPSDDAVIAYDMTNIRNNAMRNSINKPFSKENNKNFFSDLLSMESDPEMTREEILDWFYLNSNIGFSEDFFNSSENQFSNMFERVENIDPEIDFKISQYQDKMTERRAIINLYKTNLNVTSSSMTEDAKQRVLDISEDMDVLMSDITAFAKGAKIQMFSDSDNNPFAGVSANKGFFDQLQDEGITDRRDSIEFAMKHMTSKNRKQIQNLLSSLDSDSFTIQQKNILDNFGYSEYGIYMYAQTKMLPYYSTYMPLGLQYFYQDKTTPVSELVERMSNDKDIRISVSFDYMDAELNPNELNPNRRTDFKGGMQQPSLTKRPKLLGREFDFGNKNWDKLDAKSKELQEIWTDFNYDSLTAYGEDGYKNVYLLPQVSKSNIDAISEAIQGKNISENIKDWVGSLKQYRADENIQGENFNGESLFTQGIRVIPKPHLNKISDPVSNDLFRTTAVLAQQSALYKARVKYSKEMLAAEDAMLNRANIGGKSIQASNSYKMMKSYIDNNLFGIKEQQVFRTTLPVLGVVDVGKILKTVHGYIRGVSLKFTPIVPITSALTAHTQLLTERWIGQYVDNDSANKGNKEFLKIGKDGITEFMDIESTSRIGAIGEHFQIFDLMNRFENASHSKIYRMFGKAAYGLHTMGNYSPLSSALLGQLYSNRIYNGYVLDKTEYDQLTKAEGKDSKVANSEWKNLKSIYDYIKVDNGIVSYDSELKSILKTDEQGIKDLDFALVNKVKKVVERIDGQIKEEERTMAQRHFLLQYSTTNKGWMSIAISNRFKNTHVNLQTGQREEGSYLSLYNYAGKVLNSLIKDRDTKAIQKTWANGSDTERMSIIRVGKDMATLGAVYALKLLLVGFADDDEDNYLKQGTGYLAMRLANETSSAQFGLFGELHSSVTSPVVGLKHITDVLQVWNGFNPKGISRGRYSELDTWQKYWIKAIPGFKPIYDLSSSSNLKSQRDSYDYFAKENEVFNVFSWFGKMLEE